jgi:hypothetical protein
VARFPSAGEETAVSTTASNDPSANLRARLAIPADHLDALNAFLLDPDARIVNDLLAVVARYGTPEEINRKARAAGELPALLDRVRATRDRRAARSRRLRQRG